MSQLKAMKSNAWYHILQLSSKQRWRVAVLMLVDIVLLEVSLLFALAARFEGQLPTEYWSAITHISPIFIPLSIAIFVWRGLYLSLWRYAGIEELGNVLLSTTCSSLLLGVLSRIWLLPRSTVVIQWCMLTVLIAGFRLTCRALRRALIHLSEEGRLIQNHNGNGKTRVLIIGAGRVGAELVKPLHQSGRVVIGFLDDDPTKLRMRIHGIHVLGTTNDLLPIVQRYNIDEVLLAITGAAGRRLRELVQQLVGSKVNIRTIPGIDEIIDGSISISEIRPISIDDLLGRDPVKLNIQQVAEQVLDQVVLVTGAGGSIGSELCRQICRFKPSMLLMLGHGENSIFEAMADMQKRFPAIPKVQLIADVRDSVKIDQIFATYKPSYVLHAAAHKHVHFMEANPDEAVKTNIFGTQNVAQAALKHGARKFVLISTDKAVNPTSVMGASKRVAEMLVQNLNSQGASTKFVSVRFGNVLGSRGSVVPLFQRQIAQGGPVTVTDPRMSRYFMTIPEAAQLVLQAAALGNGGEVFVLDMGEPVKIVDLATNLITLSGYRPGQDIQIEFIGAKPGEKLFEEILLNEEETSVTAHSRIFIAKNSTLSAAALQSTLNELENKVFSGHTKALKGLLQQLVPNYTPYYDEAQAQVAATSEGQSPLSLTPHGNEC